MQPCWLALAIVLAFISVADAAVFKCGVSWRVSGKELYTGSITPSKCQTRCEKFRKKCKFFYTTEDVNAPQRGACHIMGSVGWNKYRDDSVVVVCARAKYFGLLGVPVNNTGSSGTFTPASSLSGRTGAYRRVAASTGVVAIHVTMLPNSDEIVVFGRPQDNSKYAPQPGMAVDGTRVEWPSSIVNTRTGHYHAVRSNMGAPFCAHQVHTVTGEILVCGGDDSYLTWPGNGGWGGFRGCRLLSTQGGVRAWKNIGNMAGAHWYPSMVELPPRVSGSWGTCALVLGGQMKVAPGYEPTDHADIACPTMGMVFGQSVYDIGSTPSVAASLRQNYPTAFLLPVGDVPAPPRLVLIGDLAADVVTLTINFNARSYRLTSTKWIPNAPAAPEFSFSGPSGSVLRAIDLSKKITKRRVEVLLFGGAFWIKGPFPASSKAYRLKPLADDARWEVEEMPSRAVLRWPINLPNGKILLVGGARLGKPSGGSVCCTSMQGGPIMNAWFYDPARPRGRRFTVDPVMMPRYRLYHNTAWLGRDGSIYMAGGDQAVAPNNRPDYTMDAYDPPAIRKAIRGKVRPTIIYAPRRFGYGNVLTVKIRGGYASRCSLSKPAAVTHTSASSHRMLLLKTIKNRMSRRNVRRGGYLKVSTPKSAYVAPPGWWLIYCWHGDVWTAANWLYLNAK